MYIVNKAAAQDRNFHVPSSNYSHLFLGSCSVQRDPVPALGPSAQALDVTRNAYNHPKNRKFGRGRC
ncbi:hypothetical protein BDV93DRAFT_518690 [Ceratobasidium sp. AG-I]|nr:hypothetical protein BDV93DRAFT_518690 [Ceratobasidium sp. AG-I]